MSIKERLEHFNALRVTNGDKPLKSWSKSGAALEDRIKDLTKELAAKSSANAIDEEAKTPRGKSANKSKNVPVSKRRGEVTADVIRPYLLDTELSNHEIYEKISANHPGFFDYTNKEGEFVKDGRKWHIAWYRAQLHRKGLL